jgi:predicted kinase
MRIGQRFATKAHLALAAGQVVILDEVHAIPPVREMAAKIAQDAKRGFTGIWLDAETGLLVERMTRRGQDASDANAQIAIRQNSLQTGDIDWHQLDAGQDLVVLVAQINARLPQGDA